MLLDMYNTEVCGTKFNLVFKDRMVLVGGKSDEEPMFVNISLIEKMKESISFGYEIVY